MNKESAQIFEPGLIHVMQKLSERMRRDISRIYRDEDLPFESRWYPVVLSLLQHGPMTVVNIAHEIGHAHPTVVNVVHELKKEKWVKSVSDPHDGRKKVLSLTPRAHDLIARLEPVWRHIAAVNAEIKENGHPLTEALQAAEKLLDDKSFYNRYKEIARK